MAGRRARTGRGWDAGVPRPPRARRAPAESAEADGEETPARAGQPERDQSEWAREICLRQLAVRPRTRSELEIALRKRGVSDEVIAEVLDRYSDVGIIDDAAFARAWVSSRHHGKGLASRALAQELRRRGVDQELITEAVAELDPDTEKSTALELARRKVRTLTGDPESVFRRLVGTLARKGYPAGIAYSAAKEAFAERSAENAKLADLIDLDVVTED